MSLVTLVSGGIDSTLMAVLAQEEGILQYPLFIDYGQLNRDLELKACKDLHNRYRLPEPVIMDFRGFGSLISSGITDPSALIYEDAFLPGRNLLFLLAGCSYAYQTNSNAVAIGLLNEEARLFPDQSKEFIEKTQELINITFERKINLVTPLIGFTKCDIFELAKEKGIEGTYSCHAGKRQTCGVCVSCVEVNNALNLLGRN